MSHAPERLAARTQWRRCAFHEAGHAVVGVLAGAGHILYARMDARSPGTGIVRTRSRGRRAYNASFRFNFANAMQAIAGPVAEARVCRQQEWWVGMMGLDESRRFEEESAVSPLCDAALLRVTYDVACRQLVVAVCEELRSPILDREEISDVREFLGWMVYHLARKALLQNWASVEAIADALMARGRISGREIREIVYREAARLGEAS